MDYERLAQSIPPSYGRLVFAQMCMAKAHAVYGVPRFTYDDYVANPGLVSQQMRSWLVGAGAAGADAALGFTSVELGRHATGRDGNTAIRRRGSFSPPAERSAEDVPLRELFYSHAGVRPSLRERRIERHDSGFTFGTEADGRFEFRTCS